MFSRAKGRRIKVALLSLVLAVVVLDVALNFTLLREGTLLGRPLPPFDATPDARQEEWLAQQLEGQTAHLSQFDSELGWVPVALANVPSQGLRFNSIGARGGREYGEQPAEGNTRIVCFGDSYTYGSEVPDGDDWPAQLESRLPGTEVLNFGVPGYGTDQALLRFRREGLHGASIALLGVLIENIGRNVNRYRPLYYTRTQNCGAKPRFRLDGAHLELVPLPYRERSELIAAIASDRVLDDLAQHEYFAGDRPLLQWSSLARIASAWKTYRRRRPAVLWSAAESEPVRVTLALIRAFVREARSQGAERVGVLIFPRQSELEGFAQSGRAFWDTLYELREEGIQVIDLTPPLAQRAHDTALYVGGHLSRSGNALVAAELQHWLEQPPR